MNFQIYKEKEIFTKPNALNKDNMVGVEKGKIDLSNIADSSFDSIIRDIPIENQWEFNEKGTTSFEVIKRYIIELY